MIRSGAPPAVWGWLSVHGYQTAIRLFCDCAGDPRYEWTAVHERLLGSHPAQVGFEWNSAGHLAEYEGGPQGRLLTKNELQRPFDYAGDRPGLPNRSGHKGWLAACAMPRR